MERFMKRRNRLLSSTLAIILCLSMLGVPVLATDGSEGSTTTSGDILNGAGEFEDFELGTDWAWVSNKAGTYALGEDDGPSGKYLQVTADGSVAPQMQGMFKNVAEGETEYTVKFHIKKNTSSNPSIVIAELEGTSVVKTWQFLTRASKASDSELLVCINGTEAVPQGEWTEFSHTFTTDSTTNGFRIRLTGAAATDDFCVDGLTIVEGDGSEPTPEPTTTPTEAPTEAPTAAPTEEPAVMGDVMGGAGEFEDYVYGTNWNWVSGKAGTDTLCEDDNAATDPAGKYLQITADGSVAPQMQGVFRDVAEGETEYTVKFYIKRNTTSLPYIAVAEMNGTAVVQTWQFMTRGGRTDGNLIVSINGDEAVPQSEWTPFEYTFTTASTTNGFRIRLLGNSVTDDFCIDGIKIEKYDPNAATPTPTVVPATPEPTEAPTPEPTEAPTAEPTAAPITPGDILKDIGEFEDFEAMGNGWNWYSGEKTATLRPDDDATTEPTGKYLQITDGGSMQWASEVEDVEGETKYTIKFYIKRNSDSYPYIQLAEKGTISTSFTTIKNLRTDGGTNTTANYRINGEEDVPLEVWMGCEYSFTTIEGTNQLRIRVIGNDCTDYCLDGITIVKASEASINGTNYNTLQKAIAAATGTDVIQLIDDVDLGTEELVLLNGTLDLNGKTLTAKTITIAPGTKIVDDSDGNAGIFKGEIKTTTTTASTDAQVPVYDGNKGGYVFVTIKDQNDGGSTTDNAFKLIFRPSFGTGDLAKNGLLVNGGTAAGISIKIRLTWTDATEGAKTRELIYKDDADYSMIADVYTNTKAFYINVSGTKSVDNLKITPYIESATGVVYDLTTFSAN